MFTNVIVGINGFDGGRDAVALARALCDRGRLTLVGAYPTDPVRSRPSVAGYGELLRRDTLRALEAARADLPGELEVEAVAEADTSPARALHRQARERGADLVVLGSAHHGRLGGIALGDVGVAVLHDAPCPVAVAPKRFRGGPPRRVGVGYDGSPEAEAALDVARAWATGHAATLDLCVVWEPVPMPIAAGPYVLDVEAVEQQREHAARQLAEETLQRLPNTTRGRVLHGRAAPAIEALARHELDLVVVGSRGWGAAKRIALGSTSHHLVHHAPCPVVVVPRPADAEERDKRFVAEAVAAE